MLRLDQNIPNAFTGLRTVACNHGDKDIASCLTHFKENPNIAKPSKCGQNSSADFIHLIYSQSSSSMETIAHHCQKYLNLTDPQSGCQLVCKVSYRILSLGEIM